MLPFKELLQKYNINITGVVHLGGSTGQERQEYDDVTNGKVIWVEAIPSVYEELKNNLIPYPNQIALLGCLSNVDDKYIDFNISNNESQSSSIFELGLHKDVHPEVHYVDKITVKANRFDTLIKLHNVDIDGCNFLNTDLQGAESLAIEGMGDLIKQFDWVWSEVNKKETYLGCMTIEDFDYFMLQRGFERVETGNWVGDIWTDALYKRVYK